MRTPDYDLRKKLIEFSDDPDALRELYMVQDAQRADDFETQQALSSESTSLMRRARASWIRKTLMLGEQGTKQGKRASNKANADLLADRPWVFCLYSRKAFGGAISIAACEAWQTENKFEYPATYGEMWAAAYRSILHLSDQKAIKKGLNDLLKETLST